MHSIHWISEDGPVRFPDPSEALVEPEGLLAAGGTLSEERLLLAYRSGIFPWYDAGQPVLWWSPDPRAVLFPDELHVGRSLRRRLRQQPYRITLDTAFERVIAACSEPRPDQSGTWITPDMRSAYVRMHELGHAHSAEAWRGEELVGGIYGIAIGRVFFGESMFTRAEDASKIALVTLIRYLAGRGLALLDCQQQTPHLERLGSRMIPREEFLAILGTHCVLPLAEGSWRPGPVPA